MVLVLFLCQLESIKVSHSMQSNVPFELVCAHSFVHLIFKVYNAGPSTLPGSFVNISFPNRLSSTGAEMFQIRQMMVSHRAISFLHRHWQLLLMEDVQYRESLFNRFGISKNDARKDLLQWQNLNANLVLNSSRGGAIVFHKAKQILSSVLSFPFQT